MDRIMKQDWDERYRIRDLPWDTGIVDFHLKRIVRNYRIKPCRVLELGCGTGTNAIWLAKQGFRVTAVDISPRAIELAAKKVGRSKVRIKLIDGNVFKTKITGGPFGFVFDRGVFHSLDDSRTRKKLARLVSARLRKEGLWLSLIGSADGPLLNVGPPRLKAQEIISAVEPYFKLISLKATRLGKLSSPGPAAWECLMQKRR